jgi:hypothetical protein
MYLELNLNPEIEKQLFETINIAFNGSYEKFIENSLMLTKLAEDREDILLATEALERLEKGESYILSLDELEERFNGLEC